MYLNWHVIITKELDMNIIDFYKLKKLLGVSIIALVLLVSCSITDKYQKQSAEKWNKDILNFEQQNKNERDPDNAILLAGSSSIRLWSTLKEDVAPYPVIQRGFGGSKFSDLAVYAKDIIYPHDFRALVIFEGNDITGDVSDKSPQEVARLFKYIVKTVRRKYPTKPVFVIEITPTPSRWHVWPKIRQANQMLKEICLKMPATYFIETSSSYLNKDGEPRNELFIKDKLHQNHDGYKIWGNLVRIRLDEVLNKGSQNK